MDQGRKAIPAGVEARAATWNTTYGIPSEAYKLHGQHVSTLHLFSSRLLIPTSATLKVAISVFDNMVPGTQDFTRASETKRRHSQEKHDADLEVLQALEL